MMDDTTELATLPDPTKVDTIANPVSPGPETINGVKVYPTSYVPVKAVLHYPKKALISMELIHIEGIHIVVFFVIMVFLFIGMWRRAGFR